MSKVKICGVKREQDVQYLNKYLPEYAGFVLAQSKRQVSVEKVKVLAAALDKRIRKVGVFVNEDIIKVVDAVYQCRLDIVQIHGDEDPEYFLDLKKRIREIDSGSENLSKRDIEIWKAVRVKNFDSIRDIGQYAAEAFVLDTFTAGSYGGAGIPFDWEIAVKAKRFGKIILAGGLNSGNVNEAIRVVRPFAVDVSSGVEVEGSKDDGKVRDFICAARSYGG